MISRSRTDIGIGLHSLLGHSIRVLLHLFQQFRGESRDLAAAVLFLTDRKGGLEAGSTVTLVQLDERDRATSLAVPYEPLSTFLRTNSSSCGARLTCMAHSFDFISV
jgi:hypothetical protein